MKTYFIYAPATGRVKIGRSVNVDRRFRELYNECSDDLIMLGTIKGDFEREFHSLFCQSRIKGEWFFLTDAMQDVIRARLGFEFSTALLALRRPVSNVGKRVAA